MSPGGLPTCSRVDSCPSVQTPVGTQSLAHLHSPRTLRPPPQGEGAATTSWQRCVALSRPSSPSSPLHHSWGMDGIFSLFQIAGPFPTVSLPHKLAQNSLSHYNPDRCLNCLSKTPKVKYFSKLWRKTMCPNTIFASYFRTFSTVSTHMHFKGLTCQSHRTTWKNGDM